MEAIIAMDDPSDKHMSGSSWDYGESILVKFLLQRAKYKRITKALEEQVKEIEILDPHLKSQKFAMRAINGELVKELE